MSIDTTTRRLNWIQASQHFIGKQWDDGGFHCYELVREMYRLVKQIELPQMPNAKQMAVPSYFQAIIFSEESQWQETDEPVPGTIVAMSRHTVPHHCGVYVGQQFIAHVFERRVGVMLSRRQQITAQGWNIVGFYNWAGAAT